MAYIEHLLILVGIYIILTVSLNLVIGFTGLLNLGHAAFFGIGAYTSALLALNGVNFWIALICGLILAGFFGFLIGLPTLKLRGDYLAIATLGFGEIIRAILKNWTSLTRGPLGLPGIPRPGIFGLSISTNESYLILVFVIVLVVLFVTNRIVKSPFGRVLESIREDELASKTLGKNTVKFKLISLAVGAGIAGVAGSLYAHYITFIDPSSFTLNETILIASMVVLGGMGSIKGSCLGAALLILLPEPIRFLRLPSTAAAALRQMIYSVVLIVLMIYRPEGIIKRKKGEFGMLKKFTLYCLRKMKS